MSARNLPTHVLAIMSGLLVSAAPALSSDCKSGDAVYGFAADVLPDYDYMAIGGGFIVIDTWAQGRLVEYMVLEHCPSRRSLKISADGAIPANARNLFWTMVNSEQRYTLEQMGDVMLNEGVGIGVGKGIEPSCACRLESDPATRKARS